MTSKPVRGIRIDKATGKLTKRAPRMSPVLARAQQAKADREEKAWIKKSKPSKPARSPTSGGAT